MARSVGSRGVLWASLAVALATTSCATQPRYARRGDELLVTANLDASRALAALESDSGPRGFAKVSSRLYRGGQPSPRHLALLRAVGVTRVVDLRREALGVRRVERATARRLGMELVAYPFYGVFGADPLFLEELLEELARDDGGAVYVHCDDGRGRTGLVVALHRVVTHGWSPDRAWATEVLAHGHRPSIFSREIELTFRDHVRDHQARIRADLDGPARRSTVADSRDEASGSGANPGSHRAPSDVMVR